MCSGPALWVFLLWHGRTPEVTARLFEFRNAEHGDHGSGKTKSSRLRHRGFMRTNCACLCHAWLFCLLLMPSTSLLPFSIWPVMTSRKAETRAGKIQWPFTLCQIQGAGFPLTSGTTALQAVLVMKQKEKKKWTVVRGMVCRLGRSIEIERDSVSVCVWVGEREIWREGA